MEISCGFNVLDDEVHAMRDALFENTRDEAMRQVHIRLLDLFLRASDPTKRRFQPELQVVTQPIPSKQLHVGFICRLHHEYCGLVAIQE
ncbi:hypothetical protein CQ13_37490 [Bradyrhizobium retamae]|uniref:Uncharacterized protein n=1 Tax=Bradyrhizobium retamae TaxID=1300035 RepID=A0A0R3M5W2_9BRAD|nr:hypothetical protein CQ13_37490 [Bradyrhizobium retamae]